MATYNNRLSCKPCHGKVGKDVPTEPEKEKDKEIVEDKEDKKEDKPQNQDKSLGSDSLNTIQCGKKILSITKVGEKVVVMYEDCTFSTAPLDVVAKESFNSEALQCLSNHMKKVAEKVCALEKTVQDLANKPDNDTIYDDTEIKQSITEVKNELTKYVAKDELIVVENLEGTADLFKAFPLE